MALNQPFRIKAQVVTLAESDYSGSRRAEVLADYMDGLLRQVLMAPVPELHLTVAEFDTILADVRSQNDLLGALRAAQPVIDEISRASGELFDQAGTALEVIRGAIEANIDADFAQVVETDRTLRDTQVKIAADVDLLTRIWAGDVAAVESLDLLALLVGLALLGHPAPVVGGEPVHFLAHADRHEHRD